MTTWDNGVLPPAGPSPKPGPAPAPAPPRPTFKLIDGRNSLCLAVAGHSSDAVLTRPCPTTGSADRSAAWVAVGGTGAGPAPVPQLASVADGGMCLNIYGGVKADCKTGAKLHLATCSAGRAGNLMRFDPASSQIVLVAPQCKSLCVDAAASGAVAVVPCSRATTWAQTPSEMDRVGAGRSPVSPKHRQGP